MNVFRMRWRAASVVVLLAGLLRLWAAWQLPVDFDEPVYLQAGYDYAVAVHQGDFAAIVDNPENAEHPPLVKIMYGVAILGMGNGVTWEEALFASRLVSAFWGTLAVLIVSLWNPLAGGFLAVHTLAVKYTSQAYLEALPLFASLAAVFALLRSDKARDRWFWFSAFALGMTAAGKYSYFAIIFVLMYLFFGEKRFSWRELPLYLLAAGVAFLALNPALWHSPVQRFLDSLLFHTQYAQSAHVQSSGYPWYQPFVWISRSMAYQWHTDVFFYFGFDGLISLLALSGIPYEWKERRWLVVWAAVGMLFLLLWPTKWPQYTLVLAPALCMMAAGTLPRIYRWIKAQDEYWDWFEIMSPAPSLAVKILGALVILVIVLGSVIQAVYAGLARRGWSHITQGVTALPNNTVRDILALPDGRMVLATDGGAAIWKAAEEDGLLDEWQVFTSGNSELPGRRVYAIAMDAKDGLWFGADEGLARFDGYNWQVYTSGDSPLPDGRVSALDFDSQGRLWVGTSAGAAVLDGNDWALFTGAKSPTLSDSILSLVVEQRQDGDRIWFGTTQGISRLDTTSGEWSSYTSHSAGIGSGGIADLLVDSSGRVWAATLGGGIGIYEGDGWKVLDVTNSDLPYNTVQEIVEVSQGDFWIATSYPDKPGGLVSQYDGSDWTTYLPNRSGYRGAETVAISQDASGALWFGTLTAGIDIYEVQP